jgi:hypothetical protein
VYQEADRKDYTDVKTSRTIYVADWDYSDGTNSIDSQVTISLSSDTLVVGQTSNVLVKFASTVLTNKYDLPASGLVLSSSNEAIATVSEDGVITGVSPGVATITAYYPNREDNATTFEVTVKTQAQHDAEQNEYATTGNLDVVINDVTNLYDEAFSRLDAINSVRTQNGLSKLAMDKTLMEEAVATATEQFLLEGDTRPNGLMLSQSYSGITDCYEWGSGYLSTNATSEVSSWIKYVTGFSESVLDEEYSSIGIGIVATKTSDGQDYYGVAIFFGKATAQEVTSNSYSNTTGAYKISAKSGFAADYLTITLQTTSISAGGTIPVYGVWEEYEQIPVIITNITGSSTNSDVAYVKDGAIYAVSEGTTTITLIVDDNNTVFPFAINVSVSAGILGDVTQDGIVTEHDAQALYRYCIGVDESSYGFSYDDVGDINGDGKVNSTDAQLLYRYVMGFDIQYDIGKTL